MPIHYGWIFIVFTASLVVLTSLQARGGVITKNSPLFNQSRGYSIFLLRALSEVTALALTATIATTLKQIRWALVCRKQPHKRTRFLDFLALQEGTSIVGLLSLTVGPDVPSFKTRLWGLMRLAIMVLVPATGVVIMSQVDVRLAFSAVPLQDPYLGFGNQPMNATAAIEYTGFSDLMLSWKFAGFLGDSAHAVDLTPPSDEGQICSFGSSPQDLARCHRQYFIPGELILVAPGLMLNASYPDASIVLLENHQGYVLDFNVGDSAAQFDREQNCRTYSSRYLGAPAGALHFCVWNSGTNELQARLVTCPGPIASEFKCLNDTSWLQNLDWTVKMSAFFRTSSVAYSRTNSTILSYSFTDDVAVPVNLNSSQILEAYDHFLLDTTTLLRQNASDLPLFSGSSFPTFLWLGEPEFTGENAINPAASSAAYAVLQSLLAIPIYYCQSGVARRLIPALTEAKSASNPGLSEIFSVLSPLPERNTTAKFAYFRYEVSAGLPTLIIYLALNGLALLTCMLAHVIISLNTRKGHGSEMPPLTEYSAVDLFSNCTIEDDKRLVVYQGRSGSILHNSSHKGTMKWLSMLSVTCPRPAGDEEGLQLFPLHDTDGQNRDGYSGDTISYFGEPRGTGNQSWQSLQSYPYPPALDPSSYGPVKRDHFFTSR